MGDAESFLVIVPRYRQHFDVLQREEVRDKAEARLEPNSGLDDVRDFAEVDDRGEDRLPLLNPP